MEKTIWGAIFTIVVLPLVYIFLKRKLFPDETPQQATTDSRPQSNPIEMEFRGQWLGSLNDVWNFVAKWEVKGKKVTGNFNWTLVSCPDTAVLRLWKKRVGDSAYEFVEGFLHNNVFSIHGVESSDIDFVKLSDYTIILLSDDQIEGNSRTRLLNVKETGKIRGVRVK